MLLVLDVLIGLCVFFTVGVAALFVIGCTVGQLLNEQYTYQIGS